MKKTGSKISTAHRLFDYQAAVAILSGLTRRLRVTTIFQDPRFWTLLTRISDSDWQTSVGSPATTDGASAIFSTATFICIFDLIIDVCVILPSPPARPSPASEAVTGRTVACHCSLPSAHFAGPGPSRHSPLLPLLSLSLLRHHVRQGCSAMQTVSDTRTQCSGADGQRHSGVHSNLPLLLSSALIVSRKLLSHSPVEWRGMVETAGDGCSSADRDSCAAAALRTDGGRRTVAAVLLSRCRHPRRTATDKQQATKR